MFIVLALVAVFIVLFPFNSKAAIEYKNIMLDKIWWILLLIFFTDIAIGIDGFEDTAIYDELINACTVLLMASPFILVRNLVKRIRKKKQRNIGETKEELIPGLPNSETERTRIVKNFNEKFQLTLTESEIQRIVGGSFQSEEWAKEIAGMNRTYSSESEWYNSETGWLRAYIKAFNIQNISSDFEYQKQVCLDNFDEIFSSTDIGSFYSVEECIRQINDRFLTNFNELSFMIAYRFLEKNGKKYILPQTGIVKMTTEIDELEKKYSKGQVQQGI